MILGPVIKGSVEQTCLQVSGGHYPLTKRVVQHMAPWTRRRSENQKDTMLYRVCYVNGTRCLVRIHERKYITALIYGYQAQIRHLTEDYDEKKRWQRIAGRVVRMHETGFSGEI